MDGVAAGVAGAEDVAGPAVAATVGPADGAVPPAVPPELEQAPTSPVVTTSNNRSHPPGARRAPATAAYGSGVARPRTRRPLPPGLLVTALVAVVLAACGSPERQAGRTAAVPPTTTTNGPSSATSTSPPPLSTSPSTPPPTEAPAAPTVPAAPDPTVGAVAPPAELERAGDAGQAVVVTAPGYGATTATLSTWQRSAGGWEPVHGPWPADVGRGGFAPPGEKREGDGRTPSGTYGFDFAFGVEPDPGVALSYRRVTGPSIVWDDMPSSPSYNLWVDGGQGEAMFQTPVYDYAAVIAYNTARTPGLGSAIFLHVSTGGPTAGCVALPVEGLLPVLRWLDPAQAPVVVMGVA